MVLHGAIHRGGLYMAYFLKKSSFKKGTYLQIYESFYNHEKKQTSHRCYKTLGYLDELTTKEIPDPVEFYKQEVDKMNAEASLAKQEAKVRIIDKSPERYAGYLPLKNIMNGLAVEKNIKLLASKRSFEFDMYKVLEALIYSRCVNPSSKYKSFHDVIPYLLEDYNFSYSQLLDAIDFMGANYEKIIEIFNKRVHERYTLNCTTTYFDCTNFYFEIDKESELQRKGPSKENRKDPIVGMGLLLDESQLPIAMKVYPGNQSEKPVLRECINEMKLQNQIVGRTIHVADKGLNCAANIYRAKKDKDGYLFSKSVKQLSKTDQEWILLDNDYKQVLDDNDELLYSYKSCIDTYSYKFTDEYGVTKSFKVKEKRVVTYNPSLAKKHLCEIDKMVTKANTLCVSQAKKNEYGESAKYVTFKPINSDGEITDDSVASVLNEELIKKDRELAGYNMLVTSELEMNDKDIYNTYHNLWRIEQSFRIMKSELNARPVFLQKPNAIVGHLLICYLSVLLERIFEFKVLQNKYCSSQIFEFIRNYKLILVSKDEYVNISDMTPLIKHLSTIHKKPYSCFNISAKQVKMMLQQLL